MEIPVMEPCNDIPIFKTGELKEREKEGWTEFRGLGLEKDSHSI